MDFGLFDALCGFIIICIIFYYYCTATFNFWQDRGVMGPKPIPMFGNLKDVLLTRIFMADFLKIIYDKYENERMIGLFRGRTPILVIKDPNLIKDVLIKDFYAFSERGRNFNKRSEVEPLSQHLFNLEEKRWKPLRSKLTSVFATGKLKEMMYLLDECGDNLNKHLEVLLLKNEPIECREITARYTTDVIGVCVFGLQMNSLSDEGSEFRKFGKQQIEPNLWNAFRVRLREGAPWAFGFLKPFIYNKKMNEFFINSIKETMEYRKENRVRRHDLIDLLMNLKDNPEQLGDIELTDALLTAQAYVFFAAGFETSSTTMSNFLYALALDQSMQSKLRDEVLDVLSRDNGRITHEGLKSMKYLDMIYQETLRKYSPSSHLMRQSVKEYRFSGTEVTIPKGTKIWIPVYALHHDSKVYTDPYVFDPERFNEDNVKNKHPMYYLPFGNGPRSCLGTRFADYQSKIGLIKIVSNYRIEPCSKTCIPYINDPKAAILTPKGGMYLNFRKL